MRKAPTMSGEAQFEHLPRRLEELAAEDAAEVLEEARAEARQRVRALLADALSRSMLDWLGERAEDRGPASSSSPPTSPAVAPAAGADEHAGVVWYVYGVARKRAASWRLELDGVDPEHPVQAVAAGPLVAFASQVPRREFDDEQLRENLGDPEWVERLARGHERVLEELCDRGTVIPMRVCTVFRTEGGIDALLEREANALEDALSRLEARTEWGVKVFFDPGSRPRQSEDASSGSAGSGASGTAYLEHRRQQRDRRTRSEAEASRAAEQIHRRLAGVAAECVLRPPQRREVSGHQGEMIVNGAYLVDVNAREGFHRELERLRREFAPDGLELVATGPWPPYNFVPAALGAAL